MLRITRLCLLGRRHRRSVFTTGWTRLAPPMQRCCFSSGAPGSSPSEDKKKKEDSKVSMAISFVTKNILSVSRGAVHILKNPSLIPGKLNHLYEEMKEALRHYWLGTKLLWADIKIAKNILKRVLMGIELSRRERRQLMRTAQDVFRIVPLSIFIIVPFMELLLPFALKLFPNMLPSTFQDTLKKEEDLKKELTMRLAVADFMQETLHSIASQKRKESLSSTDSAGAKEVIDFFEKAKFGEPLSNANVIRMARLFKDELTLENVSRPQLVGMCQFMKLNPYGSDSFLRFQLRTKINAIKEDDRRILWEGVDSLDEEELQEACHERGMRARGLTLYGYKNQLKGWIDLSIQKNVPISLLIMSRAFVLNQALNPETVLRDSLSSLDEEIINEVVLEAARGTEKDSAEIRKRRLESIEFQQEMMDEEREDIQDAQEATTKKDGEKDSVKGPTSSTRSPDEKAEARPVDATNMSVVDEAIGSRLVAPLKVSENVASVAAIQRTIDQAFDLGKLSQDKLTIAELQLLEDISMGSVVGREKEMLALIKAKIEPATPPPPPGPYASSAGEDDGSTEHYGDHNVEDAAKVTPSSTTNATSSKNVSTAVQLPLSSERPAKDVSAGAAKTVNDSDSEVANMNRMKNVLDSMLNKLQLRIDTAEKVLTQKIQLLDEDRDGIISSSELKETMKRLLKRYPTDAEAEAFVRLLDEDKDGVVTVEELSNYVKKGKEMLQSEVILQTSTKAKDIKEDKS